MQEVGEAEDAAVQAGDEEKADALYDEGERLAEQREALQAELLGYDPTVRAAAGAIVTID